MTQSRENEWREISTEQAERAMALPALGSTVEYANNTRGRVTILTYEKSVLEWLQTSRPGSFFSRDGGKVYHEAHRLFTAARANKYHHSNSLDDFEVALSRLGYRCGVLVHQGRELWLLLLPSAKATPVEKDRQEKSLDETFRELIDGEEALSAADVDSLLEVLADREASTRDRGGTVATEQPRA